MRNEEKYFSGCLLGGAIGDAFGGQLKYMPYERIVALYGEKGMTSLVQGGQKVTITDDTQLTLFTAEGLLRSCVRSEQKNIQRTKKDTTKVVFHAYLRWLHTQGLGTRNWSQESYDGWLVKIKNLYGYREPSVVCLTSLGKGIMGTQSKPINDSDRCGTVIRIAPVGLFEKEETVFETGCMVGAITHGHPTAYLASGALALIIHYIISGLSLVESVEKAVLKLKACANSLACLKALELALTLYKERTISVTCLEQFGSGFMADEALGMGVYSALCFQDDFEKAILFAINQSGNSNSAAVITGSLLGAYLGKESIDKQILEQLELAKEIEEMGCDLYKRYEASDRWHTKYPGW